MRRLLILICLLTAFPAAAEFSVLGLKNSLVDFVLEQISTPGEMEIRAERVEDSADGATALVGLTVADGRGVWLSVERLSVEWSPARILRGELEIARLAAEGVTVARAPEPAAVAVTVKPGSALAEDDGDPFDWPRSPITTRVDALTLERVSIAPGVIAPAGLSFDARGAARDEGDEQAARLTLTRTDAIAGAIAFDYLRDFAAGRLDLTLEAEEAPGGLVAALAGFPADSAARLSLRGAGPLTDWSLSFDAAADEVFAAEGAARVEATGRLAAMADFRMTPGPALDPALRAALSPEARLVVDVAENEAGEIAIRRGALTARDLSLTAAGTYERRSGRVDMRLDLDAREGLSDLVEGLSFAGARFAGTLTGAVGDMVAEGRFGLDGLTTAPADIAAASLTGRVAVRGDAVEARLDGAAEGLRLDRLGPEELGAAEIAVAGRFRPGEARLEALRLAARPLTLTAAGVADLAAETVEMTYALEAPRLGPLAAAYGVDAAGALSASGAVSGPVAAPRLAGRAAMEGLRVGAESYGAVRLSHDAVLGAAPSGSVEVAAEGSRFGRVTLDSRFALRGEALSLDGMTATALGMTAEGDATVDLSAGLIDGAVTLEAPELGPLGAALGQPMSGAAAGRVTLSAAGGRQDAAFALTLDGVEGYGANTASGRMDVAVTDLFGDPSATGEAALRGAGYGEFGAGTLDLSGAARGLAGDDPGLELSLSAGRVAFPGGAADAASASVSGRVSDLAISAGVERIAAGDASVAAARLEARLRGLPGDEPEISATLTATDALAGGAAIETATLTAKGRPAALDLAFDARGALPDGAALSVESAARADLSSTPQEAVISRLSARAGEAEARLRAPLSVSMGAGATRLDGLDLALPEGRLTGDAALYADGAAGALDLEVTDLGPMARLAELPVEGGALTARAVFDTRRAGAGAEIDVTATDLAFADALAEGGGLALAGRLDWDGRLARAEARLSGPFETPLSVTASAPMRPSGGPLPTVPRDGALSGAVSWAGEIGEIWALIPAPDHMLSGRADLSLTLGGAVASPTIGGAASLTGGRYENLEVGAILVDLNATSRIEPDGAFVIDLAAEDGDGAPVSATVVLADGAVDARLEATGARLVRRDDVTASLDLDITAKGPLTAPAIAGRVGVRRAEVRLVSAMPPDIADIGPVRLKGAPPAREKPAAEGAITLDLKIEGPQDIYVRGRGLDSEWAMDLAVGGTTAAPRVTGLIEKRRGRLNLLGAPLDLTRGEIRFLDQPKPDPALDILLEREHDGVTGGIALTGPASAPKVAFVSRPALPEDEVLPRILFGRSRQSLSPAEAVTMGLGVATLLDGTGGAADTVRATIGVDVLRLEESASGPTVAVGANVADGVFVGAKQPVAGGSASVQVEIELFDNITVDSETGPDTGTSLGLNWKKDF